MFFLNVSVKVSDVGVIDNCELPCGCAPRSLEEHAVLLATEPFLFVRNSSQLDYPGNG